MAKKVTYKGYTIEELRAMSMDELINVVPSRIRRVLIRGFTEAQKRLVARIRKANSALEKGEKPKPIRTHCRDMPILPEMVGLEFEIYNGKEFKRIEIKPEMLGHYLGEFSMTRGQVKHLSLIHISEPTRPY